jgi:RimJ/RimL family protein N-acetyltransferase
MIKGNLIGIRAVESEDLEKFKTWRNNTSFRKNFREVRELNSFNQDYWYNKINHSQNDFMFSIVRLEDNVVIGACGLLYINWVIRSADFSFYIGLDELYIDESGYADEASKLLITYGFENLNLNKIWMELYEYDEKKLIFFQNKFSFKIDGLLRENCFEEGKYWNSYILSLLNSDYFFHKRIKI